MVRAKVVIGACHPRGPIVIKYNARVFKMVPSTYGIFHRPAWAFERRDGGIAAVVPKDSPDCEVEINTGECFETLHLRGSVMHRLATFSIWPLPLSDLTIKFCSPIPRIG